MLHPSVRACFLAMTLMLLAPATALANEAATGSGPLDGKIIAGFVGPDDDPDFAEELHFSQGLFWSGLCMACGYPPAPYWTRTVGSDVHFVAELRGQSGSTFRYQGVISGDNARVDVHWTKARWYWSIDRKLVFRGRLAVGRTPIPAADARLKARTAAQAPLPEWCP